jgi:hypothetical protein
MKKGMIFSVLGLAIAMIFATPSKANAQVSIGVRIGGPVFVPRPAYVVAPRPAYVVAPRPYYPYGYYSRPVVVAPAYVAPVYVGPRYFYRGRWVPRPYAYHGYYGPRYFRR